MPKELAVDYLIISRFEEPPPAATIARTLAAAGLGAADYAPNLTPPPTDQPAARHRLGTFTIQPPELRATGRLRIFRYPGSVTDGMGAPALAQLATGLSPDDEGVLREGARALDLRITAAPARILAALGWLDHATSALLDLTSGVALDPIIQRCLGRPGFRARLATSASDPFAHLAIHHERLDAENLWLHTHGLQKFGQPELDLSGVPLSLEDEGASALREIALNVATLGDATLTAGIELDLGDLGAVIVLATQPAPDHQAPYGRLRLADAPLPGQRQGASAPRLLSAMTLHDAQRHAASGDLVAALARVERALAADPDDCDALTLKARIMLRMGRPDDVLDLAEYMELCAPADYRGPLIFGLALSALGRQREALRALDRAAHAQPESAEIFAARAAAYQRLGDHRRAAEDHAHATYLSSSAHS